MKGTLYLVALVSLLGLVTCGKTERASPLSPDIVLPASAPGAKAQVVFVHGVLGDPVKTFGTAGSNWPLMLAKDPEIGTHTDVMSIGYESKALRATSNINEIANRLLNRLIDKSVFERHEKVIFVAHSMGGLIVKRMLVQLRSDRPELFKKVAGTVFLATPAGGSSLAETARWVSGNPQFEDMKPEDINTFLQVLEDDWQALLRSRTADAPYPMAFCVYETKPMGPAAVVPRSRAQTGCDDRPVAFDRNHATLVKPASPNDEVYVYVAARLKRMLADVPVPLTMQARILGAGDLPLPDNPALKSGAPFAVLITTNRPAWFYVIAQDSTGKAQKYFPSVEGGQQKTPKTSLRVPSDPALTLVLDQNTGVERIHVFAARERSPEIERLLRGVESLPTKAATLRLDNAVSSRGAFVAPSTLDPSGHLIDASNARAEVAKTLIIEHK